MMARSRPVILVVMSSSLLFRANRTLRRPTMRGAGTCGQLRGELLLQLPPLVPGEPAEAERLDCRAARHVVSGGPQLDNVEQLAGNAKADGCGKSAVSL